MPFAYIYLYTVQVGNPHQSQNKNKKNRKDSTLARCTQEPQQTRNKKEIVKRSENSPGVFPERRDLRIGPFAFFFCFAVPFVSLSLCSFCIFTRSVGQRPPRNICSVFLKTAMLRRVYTSSWVISESFLGAHFSRGIRETVVVMRAAFSVHCK